ncbi:MAG: 30S ribosomal protein S8e, partial [Candidatus Micrarchaeaceae archaeon]
AMAQFGVQLHTKSARKAEGNGKIIGKRRDKRRHEVGGYFIATKIGEANMIKSVRIRGGRKKQKLKRAAFANVLTKDGFKKAKIKGVIESKDNRNFARLNIITKGSVIETDLGKAIVLNRLGRDGCVNAKLIEQ